MYSANWLALIVSRNRAEKRPRRERTPKKKVATPRGAQKRDYSRGKFVVGSQPATLTRLTPLRPFPSLRTMSTAVAALAIATAVATTSTATTTSTAATVTTDSHPICDFLLDHYIEFNPLVAEDARMRDKVV